MRSTEPKHKNSETNELAPIMHRFMSRSDEGADLSALRHARGHPLAGRPPQTYSLQYVEEADRVQHRRCSTPDDFVAAVENLCIVWAITCYRPGN